jgi:hypothetical protein
LLGRILIFFAETTTGGLVGPRPFIWHHIERFWAILGFPLITAQCHLNWKNHAHGTNQYSTLYQLYKFQQFTQTGSWLNCIQNGGFWLICSSTCSVKLLAGDIEAQWPN